ncbi:pentatricopeptide repeat-containing protein [Aspergillus melleus]|uniref:pentatricopeptide repeat-containing protein n=1 Tax=Aspergillus melleus TaxID=138277 RepID=UPI001E8CD14F|nr:uncharacterized protein LDX57_002308 [Aspergillus melleus]KAH8424561.1 hypothetical protein LDX57_002308 [Aspergillus melleus]
MLRCHHVNALRTSVGNAIATRATLSPQCTRTLHSLARATSLRPRPAQALPRPGLWRPLGDVKTYATGHKHHSDVNAQYTSTKLIPPKSQPPKEKKYDDDGLYAIAVGNRSVEYFNVNEHKVSRKAIDLELDWLSDRMSLANRVKRILSQGKVAFAAEMVRMATRRGLESTAAWNHLFEYCFRRNSARSAFRFYNDMKKRGVRPSEVTYTTMLSGLSNSKSTPEIDPVKTALNIYRSISSDKSGVELSIIHSNAMLTVCARHGDMDTLWGVASELPETGPASPGPVTYSIVLRAILNAMVWDVEKMPPKNVNSISARKAQGVTEAKRVWADIIYRWKKGDLQIDSQMVNSMTRVLMEGPGEYSSYEVLLLLNQTTGLPILAKAPQKVAYKKSQGVQKHANREEQELEDVPFVDEGELYRPPQETLEEEETGEGEVEEENLDDVFKPFPFASTGVSPLPVGNRELYRALEASAALTQGLGAAKAYWKHITKDMGLKPESTPIHAYLQILQGARSSRAAVDLMRDEVLPSGLVESDMFVTAMKSCRRDINNMNVVTHANELLGLMDQAFPIPNTVAIDVYMSLVTNILEKPLLLMSLNGFSVTQQRSGSLESLGHELRLKLQTMAVENLRPHVAKLEEAIEHGQTKFTKFKSKAESRQDGHVVPGNSIVTTLARLRYWMNPILKGNTKLIPKPALEDYKVLSQRLQKYSNVKVQGHFKSRIVFAPTEQQSQGEQQPQGESQSQGESQFQGEQQPQGEQQSQNELQSQGEQKPQGEQESQSEPKSQHEQQLQGEQQPQGEQQSKGEQQS